MKNSLIFACNERKDVPDKQDLIPFVIDYLTSDPAFVEGVYKYVHEHPVLSPEVVEASSDWAQYAAKSMVEEATPSQLVDLKFNPATLSLILAARRYLRALKGLDEAREMIVALGSRDSICKILRKLKGVGPMAAFVLVAILGPVKDVLPNAAAACSFVGTAPLHSGTGGKTIITPVPHGKNGSARRVLYQGALSDVSRDRRRLDTYASEQLRKGKNIRSIACAYCNKLVRVAFAIIRDGSDFDPNLRNPVTMGHDPK